MITQEGQAAYLPHISMEAEVQPVSDLWLVVQALKSARVQASHPLSLLSEPFTVGKHGENSELSELIRKEVERSNEKRPERCVPVPSHRPPLLIFFEQPFLKKP